MADPLSLLRQFNMANREIVTRGDYICFGDTCWRKSVNTNYRASHATTKYYTLECLVFFLKNQEHNHPVYVKQAVQENIPVVFRLDRNYLLDYLNGKTSTAAAIDRSAPIEIPISKDELLRREGSAANQNASSGHRAHLQEASGEGDDTESGPTQAKMARTAPDGIQTARQAWQARLEAKKPLTAAGDGTQGVGTGAAPGIASGIGADLTSGQNRAIMEHLPMEKIAALKAKRMAIKRSQIIDADIELGATQAGGVGTVPSQEQSSSAILIQHDAEFMKEVLSKERVWRNRTNVLQSTGKNFAKSLFPILQSVKNREDGNKRPHSHPPAPTPSNIPMKSIPPPALQIKQQQEQQQQTQYNRYDQERFSRNDSATHGFRIDTMGTYHGMNMKNLTDGNAAPVKPSPQAPPSTNSAPSSGRTPTKRASRTPIIIIPAGNTALVHMLNVKAILEELRYTDGKNERRETELLVQRRKPDGSSVPYRIIDNPTRLADEDWNRVVAVFVQGPAWQFKGWPWGGNPVDIFANIRAFHLKWEEMKLDANVAKWNVEVISLSRTKRHLDRAAFLKFWGLLDSFMAKHKNWLRY